jgi:DMSO/TMAO reductase YedYZ molybdopterin-dependent catalytic subunit
LTKTAAGADRFRKEAVDKEDVAAVVAVWTGIPLWLLVGRVDDADSHDSAAYNDALALAGYTVDVVAADGTTATFDSRRIRRDDNIIVAYLVGGNPLPDKYFPLRLVGSDLTQKEMLGQIVTIVVHVPAIASPSAAPTSSAQAAASGSEAAGPVRITGLVANPLTLSDADLRAMDLVTFTAQTENGPQDFQGVHLNALLDTAGIKPEAKKLVITATDGYTAEVFLAEVRSCPNALLAVGDSPGHWMTLFPDLPADTWVKNVATIDVQ